MWGEKTTLRFSQTRLLHAVKVFPLSQHCCAIQSYLSSYHFFFHFSSSSLRSYHQWGQVRRQPGAAWTASSCQRSSSWLRRMKVIKLAQLIYMQDDLFSVQPSCAPHFFGGGLERNIVICLGFTFERPRVWAEGQSWDSMFGDQPDGASRLRDTGKVADHRDESQPSNSKTVWQQVPHMCAATTSVFGSFSRPSAGERLNVRYS